MNNQENPKLLVMENTVSSHISSKTSLPLILSQKQLFKPSLFVKKLKSSPFHKHLLGKKFQTFCNAVLIINFSHNNQFIASNNKHTWKKFFHFANVRNKDFTMFMQDKTSNFCLKSLHPQNKFYTC